MRHIRAGATHGARIALIAALLATLGAWPALAAPPPRVVGTLTDQTGETPTPRQLSLLAEAS